MRRLFVAVLVILAAAASLAYLVRLDAGYVLVATYPIRSDETKGDSGAFGSRKIEYDIIHVCRKRIEAPEPVSWARMRRWVKDESVRLKDLLEHTHGKTLPESDLRVILRGKSLEFYSRHYGQVFSGDGQVLEVRDALLGINLLLDDLLEDTTQTGGLRPPDSAEPASRLYLRLFKNRNEMDRDELHKTLRGTGIAQGDLEAKGWIRGVGRSVHVVPVHERFVAQAIMVRIDTDGAMLHDGSGERCPTDNAVVGARIQMPRAQREVHEEEREQRDEPQEQQVAERVLGEARVDALAERAEPPARRVGEHVSRRDEHERRADRRHRALAREARADARGAFRRAEVPGRVGHRAILMVGGAGAGRGHRSSITFT